MDKIIDVLENFPNAIQAQRKDDNTLILRKLPKKIKRFDGKLAIYELEHRWHSPGANIYSVQGNDFSLWQRKEINPHKCLFDQVNLF